MPRDSSSSSVIFPTFRVGLRALIAYCGTIETCLKRNSFIPRSFARGSTRPSSVTLPPMWRIRPSSRMRLLPSVDLPQPDSPARPMISPSEMSNVTPSSALTSPRSVR